MGTRPTPGRAPMTPDRSARRDLMLCAASCICGAVAVALLPPFRKTLSLEGLPVGPLSLVATLLLLSPLPVAAYVHRRYRLAQRLSDAMRELSRFDILTGVLNRQALATWDGMQARSPDALGTPCVLFVDIDRFKHVNDTHGHQVGDAILVEVAARITASVRGDDTVVRMGGDEFVVLCEDILSWLAAERLGRRIKEAVEAPVVIGAERIRISASVGIAIADGPRPDVEQLIHEADCAMYRAKSGEGTVTVADHSEPAMPLVTEMEIMRALDRGELVLHYQPLIQLDDERMIGVEALLRWQHPVHGLLAPAAFVPLMEESGLIVPVGAWVLGEAARQSRGWERRVGPQRALHVSVNVSPRQLNQADFTTMAREAIARGGANPRRLWLEITEGALLRDPAAAWASLRLLKSIGVSLALDDFGTGFSSLSYIRRFALDVLKIDRSFVSGIETSEEDRAIVQHVIGLAHALGMSAVAEGVEESTQADVLRGLGCDAAQGYWYGRPVPADKIDIMLAQDAAVEEAERRRAELRGASAPASDPLLEVG